MGVPIAPNIIYRDKAIGTNMDTVQGKIIENHALLTNDSLN
jgi:hypothetical protein